ncbi:UNVERIFIED_CONTAM: hypothetical protein GTU68_022391 [Idotea baltica]|nr:hypothetical protein [Idotea baltica]
MVLFFFLRH